MERDTTPHGAPGGATALLMVTLVRDHGLPERVVRHARCPVLIEHERDGAG